MSPKVQTHHCCVQVIVLARFLNEVVRYSMLILKLRPAPLTPPEETEEQPQAAQAPAKKVSTGACSCSCLQSLHSPGAPRCDADCPGAHARQESGTSASDTVCTGCASQHACMHGSGT